MSTIKESIITCLLAELNPGLNSLFLYLSSQPPGVRFGTQRFISYYFWGVIVISHE